MDRVTLVFEVEGAAGSEGPVADAPDAEVGAAPAVDAAVLVGAAAWVAAAAEVGATAAPLLVLVALLPLPDEHAVALSRQPAITSAARERRLERSGRVERTIAFSFVESIR